ncbi:hypothetical protein OFD71_32435, partial [Escherichia coli]|nr:hypothetical protein [Escherichia coli]
MKPHYNVPSLCVLVACKSISTSPNLRFFMTSTLLAEQSDSPVTPQRVLEEVFGYQTFRDGQQEVIESAV